MIVSFAIHPKFAMVNAGEENAQEHVHSCTRIGDQIRAKNLVLRDPFLGGPAQGKSQMLFSEESGYSKAKHRAIPGASFQEKSKIFW